MRRDEAITRLTKPEMDEEFLSHEFEYVANKLDLTVEELKSIFHGENKSFHDYRNKHFFIGLGSRALRLAGLEKRLFR
jgi:hypothetical protein